MRPKNDGYTAGILDGEGCVHISTQTQVQRVGEKTYTNRHTNLTVSIFQNDERLMKWLVYHYGGHYTAAKKPRKYPKAKQGWSWFPSKGKSQEQFLLSVIPYLLIKREQALLALEFIRLGLGKRGPNNGNAELKAKREDLARRCSQLNQRESPTTNTLTGAILEMPKIESGLTCERESALAVTQAA